ncbi:MAG: hypothetical protein KatS3mg015_1456 [Fimbriimonadales bacterium]|nr:MAG: hypothetical protein KatS3mg015_1456 [Fimbriimonadales bacterium]
MKREGEPRMHFPTVYLLRDGRLYVGPLQPLAGGAVDAHGSESERLETATPSNDESTRRKE